MRIFHDPKPSSFWAAPISFPLFGPKDKTSHGKREASLLGSLYGFRMNSCVNIFKLASKDSLRKLRWSLSRSHV
jgi:hypothetical protein